MSRNTNSRFATLPSVNIQRSKFRRPHRYKTTFNSGQLIPFYLEKMVLPGDTHSVHTTLSIRMTTPIHPVMDDAYLDTYFFFVPNRLVWENFEEFMGENKEGPWTNYQRVFQEPHLTIQAANVPRPDVSLYSLYDYFGYPLYNLPSGDANFEFASVSALPFRGYSKIWNDWFRSEIVDRFILMPTNSNDAPLQSELVSNLDAPFFASAAYGGKPAPVSKFHDYFTSALPEPQRGPDVMLPLGDLAPVVTRGDYIDVTGAEPLSLHNVLNNTSGYVGGDLSVAAAAQGSLQNSVQVDTGTSTSGGTGVLGVAPNNLYADLSLATSSSINQLREALAMQSFFEKSARYGTRYTELLRGHFGVQSPDARLQRSEYLGGKRIRLNMHQVLQQSATNDVSPQGNTAAYSWTVDSSDSFTYSAVEHGMIIGVLCVRTAQTYQYGIERSSRTRDMLDYYFPSFAHLGEQPIYNYEIYAQGKPEDGEVFGYQEAYADYRYKPSRVTGAFRSNAPQSLDVWHYAEKLESLPTLSSEWMHQSALPIDRTLALSSDVQPQFLLDVDFDTTSVRPMPMYSIPGLLPHF